jgi:predicted nucleic acid-binding protein
MFSEQFAERVITALLKNPFVEFFSPHFHFNLITTDPDDNKFVDCAIQANARYIVTNDHHFDVLRNVSFPSVDIMTLREFLSILHS